MIFPTFRTEMAKQLRRTRTYLALSLTVLLPLIITIAIRFNNNERNSEGDTLFRLARQSGLVVPAAALFFMSQIFLAGVVASFAGDAVAGEATTGNLRYVLVRPIGRARLLAAKLAMSMTFLVIATLLVVVTGLIAGGIAFGWHRVDIDFFDFSFHQSQGQLVQHLAIGTAYVAWGMTAVVGICLMVSVLTDSAGGAIGAGIFMFIVSEVLDAIPQLGFLRYGLPTHYLNEWRSLITQAHASGELVRGVIVQIPYLIVFLGVAFWWFGRKDISS